MGKNKKNFNKSFSDLPISKKKLRQVKFNKLLILFDRKSLFPSAMSVLDSIYPKIETTFVPTFARNDKLD